MTSWPGRLPELEYPAHFEVRLVSRNGGIRWSGDWVNVSHVLGEEYVGLEEVGDGIWDVYFGPLRLGQMDERIRKIEDALGRRARKRASCLRTDLLPISPIVHLADQRQHAARGFFW